MFVRFISIYDPFTFLYINPTNPLWYFLVVLFFLSLVSHKRYIHFKCYPKDWRIEPRLLTQNKNLLTIKHDNHLSLSIPDHHKIICTRLWFCVFAKRQSVKIIYSILKIACNWQLVEMHFGRQRARCVCVYSCVFAAFFQIYFHLNAIYFSFFFLPICYYLTSINTKKYTVCLDEMKYERWRRSDMQMFIILFFFIILRSIRVANGDNQRKCLDGALDEMMMMIQLHSI